MRHVKQLLYGIFFLAFWAALFGGIYAVVKPEPSCFDNRRNQNETGVDCGGVCAKVCIPSTISPLAVSGEPKLIVLSAETPATAARVSIVAEVQNRNLDFGASDFDYTFRILAGDGTEIAAVSDRSFIYPGEIKRLTLLNKSLPVAMHPASARLEVSKPVWTPSERFPRPLLAIQNVATAENNGNLATQGILVNQDSVDFRDVYLTAVYYGANGAVLGVSGTERNNVVAGESREFTLFHPAIPDIAPERTQVFVTAFNLR